MAFTAGQILTAAELNALANSIPLRFDQPAQSGSGSLGANAAATVATINIPSPGFSYRVKVWGTVVTTTPAIGVPAYIQFTLGSATWDTGRIGTSHTGIGYVAGYDAIISAPPRWSGIVSGAQTLRFLIKAAGNAITVGTANYNFGAEIWPS